MPLDPIRTTQSIIDSYQNYLATTFRLRDTSLQAQFERALRSPGKFAKGPVLEATPPFEEGMSIDELVREHVLSPRFRTLNSDNLPLGRPLYLHQEQAIRKVVAEQRNVVVATGTGSGKTETFLVPILNHLFSEHERHALTAGVRALLLYPMNALANDQMARLRGLLEHYPQVTFGRYTGETEEETAPAIEKYVKMFHRQPLANELISRQQMRAAPPHILLTNYAMLEYLLLRPSDHVFFDGQFAGAWRFLVIDEAHTYSGARGIEMAMLLRRLKDRIVEGQRGRLQCMATSATLGRGEEDFPGVVQFASQLFDESFAWTAGDPMRQDVIKATRKSMAPLAEALWKPDASLYPTWAELIEKTPPDEALEALVRHGRAARIPKTVLQEAMSNAGQEVGAFLFHVLKANDDIAQLRRALEAEPRYLSDVAVELFGEQPDARARLVALVDLAARAKPSDSDHTLLPARYHLFVRAIEGAYVSLRPEPQLYLERRQQVEQDGQRLSVFELAVCRPCGAAYLVGEIQEVHGATVFKQPGKASFENRSNVEFLLLVTQDTEQVPDDEDELVDVDETVEVHADDHYHLCAACGAIDHAQLLTPLCSCKDTNYLNVVHVPSRKGQIHLCPACGARSPVGLVYRFLTGTDATASVLATALYQQIPSRPEVATVLEAIPQVDAWSSTAAPPATAAASQTMKGEGRQLLIFSDSRQDAAFFAPYLNRTYSQILRRRLILKTLEDHRQQALNNKWRVQDIVIPLKQLASSLGLFVGLSSQEQESEVWKWILYEAVAVDRRNSLEGLGYLGFGLVKPERWLPPGPLLAWGLNDDEVWTLFQVLLDTFRTKGALLFPDTVSPEDEFFSPRNREYYFRGAKSDSRKHIFSWSPTGAVALNARLDFLMRLVQQGLRLDLSREDCVQAVSMIWSNSLAPHNPSSGWYEYFSRIPLPGEDVVYRIKSNYWELRPSLLDPSIKWYHCPTCNSLTLHNLRGVCPTYRCHGQLQAADPAEVFEGNHYRRIYRSLKTIDLVAKEHTAQLTSEAAAELQTQFIQGMVNALSCSTTFELGVDVGQLEAVFMRNVPPSAANYVQRAGRAGRRTSSTAFALTFAQRRSHDLTHFNDPKQMIAGRIRAPYFKIANEKIVRRHVFATALAAFWKEFPDTFGTVKSFFFREGRAGPELVADFLARRPNHLRASLEHIVPDELKREFGLTDWGWASALLDSTEGVLAKANDQVTGDVLKLEEARASLIQRQKPSDYLLRVINTIQRTYLINFLSSHNVIPKYGFPVDVVSLQILHHADEARGLELDRDLRIALSEYAPSSQVVAGGRLWTSQYLKRLPDRDWRKYKYAVCDYCNRYQRVLADTGAEIETCIACHRPIEGRDHGVFVIPEFGFITSIKPPAKPGDARPERTYSTRTFYSGESKESDKVVVELPGIRMTALAAAEGELAVVNHAGYQGFRICPRCGYTQLGNEKLQTPHLTPWRTECNGVLQRYYLGHEFRTDILQLHFEGYANSERGFWLSLLYALLEGLSLALDIERQDLDGCLYSYAGDPSMPAMILYDEVPGGAGHVRRVIQLDGGLSQVLKAALARMSQCDCGGELQDTSCYGCLRNYRNQYCHDELKRGPVIEFLRRVLGIQPEVIAKPS